MSLLELVDVGRSYGRRGHRQVILDGVSLAIDERELVSVWGMRRSGRTTLLRIAAGVEEPSEGSVLWRGEKLRSGGAGELGEGIAYCREGFDSAEGRLVLEQLLAAQQALGCYGPAAEGRARDALRRVGAEGCATREPGDLDTMERVRVNIARALSVRPALLIADEPTLNVPLAQRDVVLELLRSIADEGVAVLVSDGETASMGYADRALTLGHGTLRGELVPSMAPVVRLHADSSSAA
ncbi:MAG: ATP-binding cassette domain-containing protein [Solirubrobacteraceae bacterium]